ncbi:MAG: efflux RND transporter periplasmic adaptor subunit [Betaproteobacteria bacterium]|nr:efflux RND transporter periplasmic adaptor subunit [Betaproteobacteria bacterium]
MTRRSKLRAVLAVLAVGAVLLAFPSVRRVFFGPGAPPASIVVSGNIEAHQSVLSFAQVQAPIVYLPFDEGQAVKAGTVLARVDRRPYAEQLRIDAGNLGVARAQVAVDAANRVAAQKTVVSDRYDLAEKRRELRRDERLLKHHATSRLVTQQAFALEGQSAAQLARDQALVRVASNTVRLAQASLKAARAKVRLDRIVLSYTRLTAPFAGVLAVREAELGELAGPGVAVFTLDDLDHVWLRAYVNEPNLGQVRLGEGVAVSTDTYPGKVYHGTISFISPQAEFTPKTVETHAERVALVYRIRIDIANPTHELLPGMPADATIALLPAGK